MTNLFASLEKASAHMHSCVGSEPLLQAAGAWGAVAQKLETAADKMLLVITWCDGQYWQSPAALQMRYALTSVTQGLKNNAVVAGQIKTAATTVADAFNKAQAATPKPYQVKNNRKTRARLAATDRFGLHQPEIAKLDADYEVMWLHSITVHAIYHHDTSQALARGEQTWWSPHQQPAGAPTTARDHPPTHNASDIPAQITQYRDTAALCRLYALDHAIHTRKRQEEYKEHSTYAKTCKDLADRNNATAELYNKMAQLHREAAQLHQDLPLGRAGIIALADKYVDLATTWHQTTQQTDTTIAAHHAASKTQPHLQEIRDNLSARKDDFANRVTILFTTQNLDPENPDLHSYTNSLQRFFEEQITNNTYNNQWEAMLHEGRATIYAIAAASIQDYASHQAKEAVSAWRSGQRYAQPITDHAHDFAFLLQTATRQDHQAQALRRDRGTQA